jgi:hypothetical protein
MKGLLKDGVIRMGLYWLTSLAVRTGNRFNNNARPPSRRRFRENE